MHTFRDLETAAYCPRKLYYRKRDADPDTPPESVARRRELAFQYERLLRDDDALAAAPIAVTPTQYRSRLGQTRARLDDWAALADPPERGVHLAGKDARGVAHKVLADPPRPSLVFAGEPPDSGVWEPQTVRLVAAAKALAWERERPVETAFAEYPAYGVVRRVALTTRRAAAYRSALRTASTIDGPPARTDDSAKCAPCEYQEGCGVRTRSMRSML
jgi:CRISPR-associated exonuclease Cas4